MTKKLRIVRSDRKISNRPRGFNYSWTYFGGNIYGVNSIIGKDSYLQGSIFNGEIHFEGMQNKRNTLYMEKITAYNKVFLNRYQGSQIRINSSVFLNDLDISEAGSGKLNARYVKAKNILAENAGFFKIYFNMSTFENFYFVDSVGGLRIVLKDVIVKKDVNLNNSVSQHLDLSNAKLNGNTLLKSSRFRYLDLSGTLMCQCSDWTGLDVYKFKISTNTKVPENLLNYLTDTSKRVR